jgi:chloramphenicol O-acetyltransferase type A
MDYPQYNICMNLDITSFVGFTKRNNLSFYYAMIHAATTVINEIEEFRYRIHGENVVVHDKIHPSFTDTHRNTNDDLFKFVTVDLTDDIFEFERTARETNENQQEYFPFDKLAGRDDLIYITCIPWISFTHVSHTISLNKDDAVPRISWGKYFSQGDRIMLPFSVQVNHALVDGYHVGQYVNRLQDYMNEIAIG